ncbi:MAG: fluoride efflux transporter CrcB [Thermodesulfobacteriota bacterium]
MNTLVAIMIGGGIGAVCRHWLFVGVQRFAGPVFPAGTMAVNLLGCLLIGLLWGLSEHSHVGEGLRLFLFTGFLGGFTTFSTFGRETAQLIRVGEWATALSYVALSNLGGILLVMAGFALAAKLLALLGR